jgi:hypothetical protein
VPGCARKVLRNSSFQVLTSRNPKERMQVVMPCKTTEFGGMLPKSYSKTFKNNQLLSIQRFRPSDVPGAWTIVACQTKICPYGK